MRRTRSLPFVALLVLIITVGSETDGCGPQGQRDPTAPATSVQPPASAEAPSGGVVKSQVEIVTLFSNTNDDGVRNGADKPATLVLERAATITYLQTYHWNNGAGVAPGEIVLRRADGAEVGRWPAHGEDGQGGVRNAYWAAEPIIALPAGTYLVEDSDAATRSTNDLMKGIGQTVVRGFYEE